VCKINVDFYERNIVPSVTAG